MDDEPQPVSLPKLAANLEDSWQEVESDAE
jgi:hypothetical protein